jgi:hypothetical protein
MPRPLVPPWRWPSVSLACFLLAGYGRSAWLWAEFVVSAAIFVVVKDYAGTAGYWFTVASIGLSVEAVAGTSVFARRALGPRAYLPLTRLRSRGVYVRGIALSASVIRVPLCLLFYALVLLTKRMTDVTTPRVLASLIALLASQLVLVAGTTAFTPPVATRVERIGLALWLILALSWYTATGMVAQVLAIVHLPLAPLGVGYQLAQSGRLSGVGAVALLGDAALVGALIVLAGWWLSKRDLGNL